MPGLAGDRAVTALRLEGVAPSVAHRAEVLAALLKPYGVAETLGRTTSRALWRAIRDVMPFAADDRPVWRVSTAPTQGAAIAAIAAGRGWRVFFDWAGGLIWIALPPSDDAGSRRDPAGGRAAGGHATLIRAPAAIRAAVEVFEPQDAGVAALTRRVKDSFDPKGVLNPGRMWAGV